MIEERCAVCGQLLAPETRACPDCEKDGTVELRTSASDRESYFMSTKDYSAPENYPGY